MAAHVLCIPRPQSLRSPEGELSSQPGCSNSQRPSSRRAYRPRVQPRSSRAREAASSSDRLTRHTSSMMNQSSSIMNTPTILSRGSRSSRTSLEKKQGRPLHSSAASYTTETHVSSRARGLARCHVAARCASEVADRPCDARREAAHDTRERASSSSNSVSSSPRERRHRCLPASFSPSSSSNTNTSSSTNRNTRSNISNRSNSRSGSNGSSSSNSNGCSSRVDQQVLAFILNETPELLKPILPDTQKAQSAAAALGLYSSAASLMLLLPPALPSWQDQAYAATLQQLEQGAPRAYPGGSAADFSADVDSHLFPDDVVQDAATLSEVHNMGFLSLEAPTLRQHPTESPTYQVSGQPVPAAVQQQQPTDESLSPSLAPSEQPAAASSSPVPGPRAGESLSEVAASLQAQVQGPPQATTSRSASGQPESAEAAFSRSQSQKTEIMQDGRARKDPYASPDGGVPSPRLQEPSSGVTAIAASPAVYNPNISTTSSSSSSSSNTGGGFSSSRLARQDSGDLLVPVAASAAAAVFSSSAVPSALLESAMSAQSVLSAVPGATEVTAAAVEVVSAAAEPVVAGAAAASEAVAAAAASVAEPVVASAAAAAASAGAGLSAKLSLIMAQSLQHLGVGGVAGAVGATVVYPLDTVKTRMQAQVRTSGKSQEEEEEEGSLETGEGRDGERSASGCAPDGVRGHDDVSVMAHRDEFKGEGAGRVREASAAAASEPYKNEVDCLVRMVQEEGVSSLYCGIGAQLVGIAPEKAVKLAVNEVLLAILEALMPGTRVWMLELIAGGGGGACQVVFTNPVEAIKVRMQAAPRGALTGAPRASNQTLAVPSGSQGSSRLCSSGVMAGDTNAAGLVGDYQQQQGGVPRAAQGEASLQAAASGAQSGAHPSTMQVVKELGLRGLYNGSTLTLARDVPSTALFFACYSFLTQPEQQERLLAAAAGISPSAYVFLAACASSIPTAVLVTPFDVVKTRMQMLPPSSEGSRSSAWEVAVKLVAEEGLSALFKGGIARALRVGPQLGITLMTYDWLCKNW